MPAWTKEELDQVRQLRQKERAESAREKQRWDEAVAGFEEEETVYTIQYLLNGRSAWFAASPFFEPVRTQPDETHDENEAHRVAAELLAGQRGVTKQSAPDSEIVGVRVVERYTRATIVSQTHV